MRKTVLAVTAAAVLSLAGAPAYAQGTVTPASPSCAEALIKFKGAEKKLAGLSPTVDGPALTGAALTAAVEADPRVVAARKKLVTADDKLEAAKAALAATKAADNAQDPPVESDRTKNAQLAVDQAQRELDAANGELTAERTAVTRVLGAKPTVVPNPAVDEAKKERDTAKAAADTACKGQAGATGATGATGAAGTPGQSGTPGTPGAAGASGTSGTPGTSGSTGAAGTPGGTTAPSGGSFTQVGAGEVPVGGVDTGA